MNVVFDFGAVLFAWRPAEIVAETFPDYKKIRRMIKKKDVIPVKTGIQ